MKTQYLYLLLLPILFCQSCEKLGDGGCGGSTNSAIYYFYLTEAAIKKTPYFTNPLFDTISFASDKGDTLSFVKTKTDTMWFDEQGGGSPDCGYSTNRYQQIRNTYTTIKGNGKFEVKHSKKTDFKGLTNIIEISFNNYYFIFGDIEIGNKAYINYISKITLSNKDYFDCLFEYSNDISTIDIKGYLNKQNGLFGLNDNVANTNYKLIN